MFNFLKKMLDGRMKDRHQKEGVHVRTLVFGHFDLVIEHGGMDTWGL
jgi:hypothetical protein